MSASYTQPHPKNDIESYPHWDVREWTPALLGGRIERIYMHWSGHDYFSVHPAYHFCIALSRDARIVVVETHDVCENMRDVTKDPEQPYAAHTRGRNSFAIGVSVMAMEDATPHDFGSFPLTEALIAALCDVTAKLARCYDVPVDAEHVMSHAEAAIVDGYFGTGPDERWDIARLAAHSCPLLPQHARETGDELRARIRSVRAS